MEIRAIIRPGTVFYFSLEGFSSSYPHYFVVVNRRPLTDPVVLLLCASSQVEKRLTWYSACPPETLVIVYPRQYNEFTVKTVINCNEVYQVTIQQLAKKRDSRLLAFKSQMSDSVVESLRRGVIASPMIERWIKALLA